MTRGLCTWRTHGAVSDNVLLVVNSVSSDTDNMAALYDELQRLGGRLHAVVPPAWHGWFIARGWPDEQLLAASNAAGDDLELNYYLESPAALQWILNRQCAVVVGSAPHNLYNEEVKYIFERRVALFLGAGRFLAHTLPNPYVYALTLSDLLHRQSRPARIAEYGRTSQALVADLHAHWIALGGPVVEDETPFVDVAAVLSRRLEPDVSMFYDEAGLPSPPLDAVSSMVEFVAYLETVLHSGLLVLDAEITHLQKEVDAAAATARGQATEIDRRDAMLAALADERIAAVDLRDRRIDQLQNELEFMTKGWRRFVVRRR